MEENTRHPLAKQDINQLISLCMILKERNLSRAAKLLDVTQSAMSHNLSKARSKYSNDLLVRQGQEMVRTPFAERLLTKLEPLVENARLALNVDNLNSEETLQQKVTISMPEVLLEHIGFTLMQRVKLLAPHLCLDFVSPGESEECDLVITDTNLDFRGDAINLYSETYSILSPTSNTDTSSWISYVESNNWLMSIHADVLPSVQTKNWSFFIQMLREEKANTILPLSLAKAAHKLVAECSLIEPEAKQYCQWIMYKKSSTDNSRAWLNEQIRELALGFFTA